MTESYNISYQRDLKLKDNKDGTFTPVVATDGPNMREEALLDNGDITVEPGKSYVTSSRIGVGKTLGVGVLLGNYGLFSISVQYRNPSASRILKEVLLYETGVNFENNGGTQTDKITNVYSIIIRNKGETDIKVRDVVITDFI